jgi:hypothetical protein
MFDYKFIQQCSSFYPKNFNSNNLSPQSKLNPLLNDVNFNVPNIQKSFLNINKDTFLINKEIYYFQKRDKSRFLTNEEENNDKNNSIKNCISEENDENKSTSSDDSQKKNDLIKKNIINNKNLNNENEKNIKKNKKEKKIRFFKGFKERNGDWTCFYCKNLNFTFRKECNRCHRPKYVSDQGHENYFNSILNEINKIEIKEGKEF